MRGISNYLIYTIQTEQMTNPMKSIYESDSEESSEEEVEQVQTTA